MQKPEKEKNLEGGEVVLPTSSSTPLIPFKEGEDGQLEMDFDNEDT